MFQQGVLNKTKRNEAHYKGSKPKSQWLAIETKVFQYKKALQILYKKLKRKNEQELLCKLDQLHHTDTESFWKLLRQVKGNKGQSLQNQHKLLPLNKIPNYFETLPEKQKTKISSPRKSKH